MLRSTKPAEPTCVSLRLRARLDAYIFFLYVCLLMMIIVYWYLFSNHYTRECIRTGERESNIASLNSPRALY